MFERSFAIEHGKLINFTVHSLSYFTLMGRHNFDVGATQLRCWGDTTRLLGRHNLGWGDKAMERHNLHSYRAHWPSDKFSKYAQIKSTPYILVTKTF